MRVLVTGASGFAGRHLTAACRAAGDDVSTASRADGVDLLDPAAARAAIADARPEAIYHLAARAHVGESWDDAGGFLRDNLALAINVFDAVRAEAPEAVVVAVGSGEVYGPPAALPVTELAPLRPQNPYAVSKASADLLAGFYADAHGLRMIRARPFNHAGPGQEPTYAIASFARQVALGTGDPLEIVPATRIRGATTPTCATSCWPTGCWPLAASPASTTSARGAPRPRASWSRRSRRSPAGRSSIASIPVSCARTR